MKDILYFNTLEDIKIVNMLRTTSKEKELPNQIILTIQSAGAGEVTPIFSKDASGTTVFSSIDEIGTKFILDEKEVTSDDFQVVTKLKYGTNYNFFGLQFEDSNEHILKISLVNSTVPNFQRISQGPGYSANSITSVVIGNSITDIDSQAFRDCTGLTSITIGNSVTDIDRGDFTGCTGLTSIVVAKGNKVYDSRNNCNAIIETKSNTLIIGCKSTIIPNSVTEIGNSAFSGPGLTSITIPDSVTKIGDNAFSYCMGLTSIIIPNSVTSIGDQAFISCNNLNSVSIGNSVTKIGENTFNGCTALTSITIPSSVTEIGGNAFYNCRSLTSVILPNSMTEIKIGTFSGCTGLTNINIPESVTSIGNYAFSGCSGLTSVNIPKLISSIGNNAFDGCTGIVSLTWNAVNCSSRNMPTYNIEQLSIGNEVQILPDNFVAGSKITSVTIPNSVTTIGYQAFAGCGSLTSVTIGSSVTMVGESAFESDRSLTSITSLTTTAPAIQSKTFRDIKTNGTLHVPAGSDYSAWMSTSDDYLGKYSWTKVEDA